MTPTVSQKVGKFLETNFQKKKYNIQKGTPHPPVIKNNMKIFKHEIKEVTDDSQDDGNDEIKSPVIPVVHNKEEQTEPSDNPKEEKEENIPVVKKKINPKVKKLLNTTPSTKPEPKPLYQQLKEKAAFNQHMSI